MNGSRIAALAVGGFLTLGVAACGSSGSSNQASTNDPPAASTPAATPSSPAPVAKTSGALTPPGTKLAFQKQAKVGWVPPSQLSGNGPHKGIPLEVAVEGIDRGTLADFKNVQLNAKEKQATPFYVKVRVTNLGSSITGTDNPAFSLRAIDDRGQAQTSVTFIGDFQRCPDVLPPKPFSKGKTLETCLTYLMPGGGSINEVDWNDGPSHANAVTPYFEKPVVWGAGGS